MLVRHMVLAAAVAAVFAGSASAQPAPTPPEDLLKFLPSPVNAVVVMNVSKILASPRGEREGWSKLTHTEYLAGAVPVNPSIERVLMGTTITLHEQGSEPAVAVFPLRTAIDMDKIAKSTGGSETTIGDDKAVVTSSGAYIVPLTGNLLGAMKTTHKQDVTRWVREARDAKRSLSSPYIFAAVNNTAGTNQIVMAVDAEDLIEASRIRMAVGACKSIPDEKVRESVQRYLVGLRGARFTANVVAEGIDATLRVDSRNAPPANLKPEVIKDFVIELLDRNGMSLDDLQSARASFSGNSTVLAFRVTDVQLARILSLVPSPVSGVDEANSITVAPAGVSAEATRRYFTAVNKILDDLHTRDGKNKTLDFAKMSVWYSSAASRIQALSVLNVDKGAVEYATGSAGRLQLAAESLSGLPVEAARLDSQTYAIVYPRGLGGWGGWGWGWGGGGGGMSTNWGQMFEKKQQLISKDSEGRARLWSEVEQARLKTRQYLQMKFQTDF